MLNFPLLYFLAIYEAILQRFYADYIWKNGIPIGLKGHNPTNTGYKIVADPYKKRISIEKYSSGIFQAVVYDSYFIDFRKLDPLELADWEREKIYESNDSETFLIRDHNDRIVFIEKCIYEDLKCRECTLCTPHGLLLSKHKLYYKKSGDPFDGLILFDIENHPVLLKKYLINQFSEEFEELLEENWDIGKIDAKNNLSALT